MVEWTTEAPTRPGQYWVYVVPLWEDELEVGCVDVFIFNGRVTFDIACDGDGCTRLYRPERVTHWQGPILEPDPPERAR